MFIDLHSKGRKLALHILLLVYATGITCSYIMHAELGGCSTHHLPSFHIYKRVLSPQLGTLNTN